MRPSAPRAWIAVVAAFAALATACGAAPEAAESPETVSTTHQAIFAGRIDNDGSASSSVVSLKIGDGTSFELCTGSLIAPNVVLTARHCVSRNITPTVSCDEKGKSGNGNHLGNDESAGTIHVFLGDSPKFGDTPVANGRAIFHPAGGVLCNADIALLVLDAPIPDVVPMAVRLGGATHPTETVRSVGFGQNDKHMPVGTRLRKDNVRLLAVGQGLSKSQTPLGSHEFEVGLSICQGDSGGPAISETTGAVIGVVSRGGNCTDDFGHIYTSTTGFQSMFDDAFALAGGAPTVEPGDVIPDSTSANDDGNDGDSSKQAQTTNLHAGANDKACSARIAGTAEVSNWGLAAAFGALGLLVARRRKAAK